VTVLFVDVVGSTSSVAGLDPEDARELMEPTVMQLVEIVRAHGGTISTIMGDGLMALFGAPLAQEDHAVRACNAALGMLETKDKAFGIRVGLNSGEVVIRGGNATLPGYDAVGETINLAARLERHAETDSALVSHELVRAARGSVVVEPLEPAALKGFAEPIRVYRLRGVRPVVARQSRWTRVPFIGRKRELRALRSLLEDANDGLGQFASLSGEIGTGKSRLLYEMMTVARQSGWRIAYAAGAESERTAADQAIAQVVRDILGIPQGELAARMKSRISHWLARARIDAAPTAECLFWLLGLLDHNRIGDESSNAIMRARTTRVLQLIVRTTSAETPLLIAADNFQSWDSSSREMLLQVVSSIARQRVVVVTASRSADVTSATTHRSVESRHIRLDSLSTEDAHELTRLHLGDNPSLLDCVRAITTKAGGNPFFIEEIIESLLDAGVLAGPTGDRQQVKAFDAEHLPTSIFTAVGARLDRLARSQRSIVQLLAVLNASVSTRIVQEMSGIDTVEFDKCVDALVEEGFVASPSSGEDQRAQLSHPIFGEVAYRSLLKKERKRLHGLALEHLKSAPTEHGRRRALGHHAYEAEQFDTASTFLAAAGKAAYGRSAHAEAVDLLRRAVRAADRAGDASTPTPQSVDARLELRNALFALGRLDDVGHVLKEALQRAESLKDSIRSSATHTLLIHHNLSIGDQQSAAASAELAVKLAEDANHAKLGVNARFYRTQLYASLGRYLDAIAEADAVVTRLSVFEDADEHWKRTVSSLSSMWKIWCSSELGRFDDVAGLVLQAQTVMSTPDIAENWPLEIVWAGLGSGLFWLRQGLLNSNALEVAIATLDQTMQFIHSQGLSSWIGPVASPLGFGLILAGQAERGIALCKQAVDSSPSRHGAGNALRLVHQGFGHLALGELSAAEDRCELALKLTRSNGEAGHEAYATHCLGLVAEATGNRTRALELLRAAETGALRLGMIPLAAVCKRDLLALQ
jgi:class 3 adenylate cyclase/tetratricopeptide (TPR) repeat protein